MGDCIFCKIASGTIPVPSVYEDENFVAFIDLHPLNPGHTLVIPKEHFESVIDMPRETFAGLMDVVYRVGQKVHRAYPSARLGILVKGFDVPHAHVHLIPQHTIGDIVSGKYGEHLPPEASREDRESMATRIKNIS